MANAGTKRRAALARRELLTYARPTRASITRMTGLAGASEVHMRCPRKACSCSGNQHLVTKPTPPKTRPMASTILGKYRHDRVGRTGKGRGYRLGQIGQQAGKGASQLLQNRIRQLARDIKDKHTTQATEEIEIGMDQEEHGQQNTVKVTKDPDSQTSKVDEVIKAKSPDVSNSVEISRPRKLRCNVSTISEDSQVVGQCEKSPKLSTGNQISEYESDSRTNREEKKLDLTDSERTISKQLTPLISPVTQLKSRWSVVFESLKNIDKGRSEQPRLHKNGPKRSEPLVPVIVHPSSRPSVSNRSSLVRNKERTESILSNTIREEEEESLTSECAPDPPSRYHNPASSTRESVAGSPEYHPDVPPNYRTGPAPSTREPVAHSDLENHPDLHARYRTSAPSTRELVKPLHIDHPSDRPPRPSQSQSENHTLPPGFKSRTLPPVPTEATSSEGAWRVRGNSVINISSAYRSRRISVYGFGLNTPCEEDESGIVSLSTSSTQSCRASVVDIFRRSKQSRHRRLSLYLQTPVSCKEEPAIERLKRIAKTVKIIAGICLALKSYVKTGETKQWSLIEMRLNLQADMEKTLAFDPTTFSKLRVTRGSEKLRSILSSKSSKRSKEDIDIVLALLRKNRTFSDYKRETQIALAKVMEYLRYEPRRIILKEGHQASGFYIILSGTCLVNQKEIDPRNNQTFVRTIDEIHSGDSFGDVALLSDCLRSVSIVCKDECEVLLVNKEHFNVIIREPLEKERETLLDFCNTKHVFEKLPTSFDFRSDHYAISAKKFKPGIVITSDINESDFIYVVRSGKCRVISEVKEIKGRPLSAKKSRRKPFCNEEWKKDAALKRSLAVMESLGNRRKWASEPKLFQKERQKTFFSLTGIEKSVDFADTKDEKDVPPILPKSLFEKEDQLQTKPTVEESADKYGLIARWRRVSMVASAMSEKERRKNALVYQKPSRVQSTYAEVAVLKEGDVFGVETLVTSSQSDTRLSLVSEGADCVVISKKFFATQATVSLIQQSIKKAIDYPPAEYTLGKIRQARAWSSYKDSLVKELCNRKMFKVSVLNRR